MNLFKAIGDEIKGRASVIALDKIEAKVAGQDHGKAVLDLLTKNFGEKHAVQMTDEILNYLLEFGEGLMQNDTAFTNQVMLYANKVRSKQV